ncbi:RagB/SusD family nutrient uptake outer membrane protein [Olivibacter sp. XZL3]|uniref:RagB/SusD family nutrient uptake outer membrane protein n=1 Tax=Olivibacter sp. XZL3 TaxID=1735116 RepID=UPI001064F7E6|nr:RagB/SusD family nutrient uptake outer membrane protein [Olivibacter sp. XZL3]
MKSITKIYGAGLLFCCLLVTACNEAEFLKEKPKDAIYSENLFVNYSGFRMAVNALLDFPRQERADMIQSAELSCIWKIGVDNGWANAELSWTRGLSRYTVDLNAEMQLINRDTEGRDGLFLILYRAISSANMIVARSADPQVDWEGATVEANEANRNLIVAHARLIRAWAYRHLALTFGAVPLNIEEVDGLNYRNDWDRNSVSEIQSQIIQDLQFAEQYLPDFSTDVLILPRVIAQHYLAEIYLWMDDPARAEEEALKVVNNTHYKLITTRYGMRQNEPGVPFMDQFYNGNILPSQGNTEALWVFPNSDVIDYLGARANSMRRSWIPNYSAYAPYTPENGGRGIGRLAITAWAFSIYEEQDDRFSPYAVRKSYTGYEGEVIETQMDEVNMTLNNNQWASTRKWDWTYTDPDLWNATHSFADQAYLRLSETYLLLAEAQMKLGKLADAAVWINQVRQRANARAITAGEVTLDFILDERSRELITEEHRRETLVRTGKLVERTRLYNPLAQDIQDYHVLLPIPQYVIDANTGKPMQQNPGYN